MTLSLLPGFKSKTLAILCLAFLFVAINNSFAQTTVTYTGNSSWTAPYGVTTATVQCWGAGGGGGSLVLISSCGGGGGGAYAMGAVTVVPGTSYNVVVGAGGTAGNAGGSSTFNATSVVALGGSGVTGNNNSTGAAGGLASGSTGTTKYNGGNGGNGGGGSSGGGGGGAGSSGAGGNGGAPTAGTGTSLNGGNGATGVGGSSNGAAGNTYGGGGSGANALIALGRTGGTGASGLVTVTYTCPALNGTYTVGGVGANFATLTSAFTAITCGGISGNVNLALQSGYTSGSETFPMVLPVTNSSYSVTVYPAATGLSITSANATGTIDFDGADNYVFDGRVNRTGSATDLIIENTNTGGYTMQFINDAGYNLVKYCNVKGVNTTTTEGVIFFNTASSAGNDYNTIDHCDVHDGASTPANCIFSAGTANMENDHITISNCNVYNFYISGSSAHGIYSSTNNSDWTISGNSVYQTVSRVPTGASGFRGIQVNSTTGDNFVISGNYVGGTAADCGGGALSFDAGATQDNTFYAVYINSSASGQACTVTGNTVTNIAFGSKSATSATFSFLGVAVTGGYVVTNSNVIGAGTGTGAITATYATTSTQNFVIGGVLCNATQGSMAYNTIGAFTVSGGNTTSTGSALRLIECDGVLTANFSINNNTLGSTTTANSIQYSTSAATPISIMGIFQGTSNSLTLNISDNTIQNITNNSTNATAGNAAVYGIFTNALYASSITAARNTIANLSCAAPTASAVFGIYAGNTTAGQTISGNTIHDLFNTYSGATATAAYGIYYSGPTSGTNVVDANTIYNIGLSGTSVSSIIYGIAGAAGLATFSNNMIALGNGITTGYQIIGIDLVSTTNGNNFYFNSVYIGGTVGSGGSITAGFFSNTTRTRAVENNIFYNARTGGTASHYAIAISSTTGWSSNYNDLYAATASTLGSYNSGTTARTFANWQSGTSGDANSLNLDPLFLSPAASTADLHISVSSPVITKGLNGTGITSDIDNDLRPTSPDIGADEYHINYYSKSTGNLELVGTWGINTDGSGANPPNFTTRDCNFNIRNNPSPTIGAAWSVTGTGNLIILGDGTNACNYTIPASYVCTGTVNASSNGTLTIQNTTNPTLNILDANSTVNYNSANGVSQTVSSAATYGNLIISNSTGSGASTKSLAASVSIAGDLSVNGFATFDLGTNDASRTGGGGTLTLAASGALRFAGTTGGASANNNFPNNFATTSLNATSTVEYYGATQTIYNVPTYGNLTITTSGTKTAGGALTTSGNLTINAAATFAAGTYTHNIGGNYLNSGSFSAGTSTINFDGTAAQTVGPAGGSVSTFYVLKINNSAGVTLLQDEDVSNTLTLSAGLLNTSAAGSGLLIMQNGSSAPALTSASTSYVNGPMQYQKSTSGSTSLNFPIGKGSDCRPVVLTTNHTNTTQYNYTGESFNANPWTTFGSTPTDMPITVDTISAVHYVTIARTDNAGASQPTANLSGNQTIQMFFGANDFVYQGATLTIVKNTSATPATWIDIGGSSTLGNFSAPQAGSVTSTSSPSTFSSFSSFALASKTTGWNSLPIELLSFTATPDKGHVNLNWSTQTETNNKFFTIEKSPDAIHFGELKSVASKAQGGNSLIKLNYADRDDNPFPGTSYYRLKQTDYNGASKTFHIVSVNFDKNGKIVFTVYPNPNQGEFMVDFSGLENDHTVDIYLHSIEGKEVYHNTFSTQAANGSLNIIPAEKISAGVYSCTLYLEEVKYQFKVIIE